MTPSNDQGRAGRQGAPRAEQSISFLEQALWRALSESATVPEFAKAWLGLQCRFLAAAQGGVVVLAETPGEGGFAPAAIWPDARAVGAGLTAAVELAISEQRPLVKDLAAGSGARAAVAAHPLLIDGVLRGAVAIRYLPDAAPSEAEVLAQLRWGAGWLEALLRRETGAAQKAGMQRIVSGYELMAATLEQERFRPACTALATDLALRLDCEQVAVGFRGRARHTRVAALSHSSQFGRRMDLTRRIGAAMDEALDQQAAVIHPAGADWEYRISQAHAELAASLGGGAVLTVPLHRGGEMLGALTLQRPPDMPFDDQTIQLIDTVASLVGPVLEEKRRNDRLVIAKLWESLVTQAKRLLGPAYFGRKLASLLALGVVVAFSLATAEFRVATPAVLEGRVQRALVAPFDAFIAAQYAKAGEVVEAGALLARFDDRELTLERLQLAAELRQHMAEYDRALNEDARVEARIGRARIEEAEAQLRLLDARLARTELRAPFDGLVIEGDLSQSVGAGVRQGEALFTVAPLDHYRLVLEVDEGDLREMRTGLAGQFVPSAIPDLRLDYQIERVTPVANAEEGRNFFRAEARLDGSDPRLRPGMEGVAKTGIEERLLIAIWSRELVDWLRLALWRWLP